MRPLWLVVSIIVIDQISKAAVRSRMHIGESIPLVGDWFKLTFTENAGMAFGIDLGSPLLVTVLAIAATVAIVLYLRVIQGNHLGYRLSLALILGGAIGNIIDRIFFAKIYGYGGFFRGQVVDFIHFDLWSGRVPDAIPLIGDAYLSLFPIWNVADMSIVIGVTLVIVFQQILKEPSGEIGVESDAAPPAQPPADPEKRVTELLHP